MNRKEQIAFHSDQSISTIVMLQGDPNVSENHDNPRWLLAIAHTASRELSEHDPRAGQMINDPRHAD